MIGFSFDDRIGYFPTDWNLKQLKDSGDFVSGSTPSSTNENYWGGDITWLVPSDLTALSGSTNYIYDSESKITIDGFNSCSTNMLPAGSLCLSSRATIGEAVIAGVELCTNQGFINIVPNEEHYALYLLYWVKNNKQYISRYAAGTTFLEIGRRTFKNLKIALPKELPEQKAIAGTLSKVDEAIEAVENSIKAAERLKKSLMQNLLTGKLKPDGAWRSEDEMLMTKYGYAPKDWKYCQIKDLIKEGYIEGVQDGNHGESHPVAAEFVNEGIPFVMASDISNGFIDVDNCKKLTRERADKLRIGFAKNGDVLLSHKASVGYTCIVNEAEPYVMLTPQVTYYRVAPDKLIPQYLKLFFQTYPFQCIMEGLAKQSTRNYIGITNQKKMWIYLPDNTDEQHEVVAEVIQVDDQVLNKKLKIQSLKKLKKSLMQHLLTGKVRVDVEKINKLLEEV
ncbi:MAG: restriction endonuclease subunit S [Candidatus Marinimicrobia bacterium]|nr:restriction endonuclease subunit S [Candidatus Neomarinimicrobiota bacterium]